MIKRTLFICLLAGAVLAGFPASAQDQSGDATSADKADAYYHYALGHLYFDLAVHYGSKGDFVNQAIDNYNKALEEDPNAAYLNEELSELYIRAGRLREAVTEFEATLRRDPNNINARRILARIYTSLLGDEQANSINSEMLSKALEQYQKITELDPKDEDSWVMLGRLHKLNTDSVAAEDAYKKALEINPDSEGALLGLAMVYSDLGDLSRTAETLRKVAGSDPSLRTLVFLAGTYEKMHDYALAAETYREALKLDPDRPEIKRALGQSLLMSNDLDGAAKIFEELVEADPTDADANLRLSQIYRQRGDLDKARKSLDAALKAEPGDLEVQYANVNLLEVEGKTDEAISVLKQILDSTARASYSEGEKSNREVFLERLGLMYKSADRYDEAVAIFRQLGELDADNDARISAQIADTYRQANDFDKALEVIEEAHQRHPDDETVASIRATVLADLGRSDEAVAAIREVTKGHEDRSSYLTQAQIFEKTKNWDLMEGALDKALELSNDDDERATVLFMQGAMHERQKSFDKAEAAFREVLRISPDNASAMNYLGYMLADRNVKLEEAHDLISKALKYEPNNGAYLDSLGWVYYRMNRFEEAEDCLRRAVAQEGSDPVVQDHLGDVYFQLGRLRDAISHWRKSLERWEASPASEKDPAQVAEVQRKLEGAEVQLAKQASAPVPEQP